MGVPCPLAALTEGLPVRQPRVVARLTSFRDVEPRTCHMLRRIADVAKIGDLRPAFAVPAPAALKVSTTTL